MLIIRNGSVIDPISGTIEKKDLYLNAGLISDETGETAQATETIDAQGLYVAPGLVDIHVHFREPGFEYKEDIMTGAAAAAAGGFTAAACMANTDPTTDSPERVRVILEKAKHAPIRVYPIAAVTEGQKGGKLTDFQAMRQAGACALSDDGQPIMNAQLMCTALREAQKNGLVIVAHSEDRSMTDGRAVNEGKIAALLGIPGRPAVAEEYMIQRDAMLAGYTGGTVHIAHISTAGSVEILRQSKAAGVDISCETCPQYFTLTEEEVLKKGTLAKVFPPLRTQKDVDQILAGLQDGTIDIIATDHAPHAAYEKAQSLPDAPGGMVGLETALAAALTALYHTGRMRLADILRKMSLNPALRLGIPAGGVKPGDRADLVIFDVNKAWTVDPKLFHSKSVNTPFAGMTLRGKVAYTICGGKVVFRAGQD